MTQEEKEKIKIVPLCRNIGEVIALNGLIFLLKEMCIRDRNGYYQAEVNHDMPGLVR